MVRGLRPVAGRAVLTAAALAGAVACASEGDRDLQGRAATRSTEAPAPPGTPTPPRTTATTVGPAASDPLPAPGSPCELGSHRDCIDPDGDGQGVYLEYGGDCMAAFADSPGLCSDLDRDGVAGYPDSG